jgi:TMEM175 potassium channel family protein
VRGSIVRFSAVGIGLYILTLVIAVVSAPACLAAHFVIAIYYCFQQIRPGSPAA